MPPCLMLPSCEADLWKVTQHLVDNVWGSMMGGWAPQELHSYPSHIHVIRTSPETQACLLPQRLWIRKSWIQLAPQKVWRAFLVITQIKMPPPQESRYPSAKGRNTRHWTINTISILLCPYHLNYKNTFFPWFLSVFTTQCLIRWQYMGWWRRKWQPTPVFLTKESQGQKSLVGCHLWGRTELDMIEVT